MLKLSGLTNNLLFKTNRIFFKNLIMSKNKLRKRSLYLIQIKMNFLKNNLWLLHFNKQKRFHQFKKRLSKEMIQKIKKSKYKLDNLKQ